VEELEMQINGLGGVSPYKTNAKTNTSGGIGALPGNSDILLSKGQSKLSEEAIKEKLLEIAKRDVANGVTHLNRFRNDSPEWQQLEKDYMSFASPDRKRIASNMLSNMSSRLPMFPKPSGMNLLRAIMKNSRLFGSRDVGNNFINIRDDKGNIIAMWNTTDGWTNCATDGENLRSREFMLMWEEAQIKAGTEYYNTKTIIDIKLDGMYVDLRKNTVFDMAKLEAHGITYDPETGKTNVDIAKLEQATGRKVTQHVSIEA
jgi:hypothetical protein